MSEADNSAWGELWQELHHQGDVRQASYAAVPQFVRLYREQAKSDWNLYALAATIEEARQNPKNPPVPDWLVRDYEAAWRELEAMALRELPGGTSDVS